MKNRHLKKDDYYGTILFSSMCTLTANAADYTDTEGVIKTYDTTKLVNSVNENEKKPF